MTPTPETEANLLRGDVREWQRLCESWGEPLFSCRHEPSMDGVCKRCGVQCVR